MTDDKLSELLERAGARVEVGAPPVAALLAAGARRRRRHALATVGAAAAAVVAVVAATTLLPSATPGPPGPRPPVARPTGISTPPGTRLVGLGHAAVAVPLAWGTNRSRCGVPQHDTVVIDEGAVLACAIGRPRGVESVELGQGRARFDFTADRTVSVDGVTAQRQDTTCRRGGIGPGRLCAGTVYLPTLRVWFRAESSTGPRAVDRILQGIRVLPGLVGVPGFQTVNVSAQKGAQASYLRALRAAGLTARVRTQTVHAVDPGYLLGVSPAPGTMLHPGDVVTVTAVGPPAGPADEVRVGVTSADSTSSDYRSLSDQQIRAGATLRLRVGDRIWAYADGRRSATLAGSLHGTSLVVDSRRGPNYPHAWVARAPGRTRVTLTVTADGKPVPLGVVTVVVR